MKNLKGQSLRFKDDKEFEDDCNKFIGKSKKSYGFGSIRIQVLMEAKKKVTFVNSEGIKQDLAACLRYMNDGNYTIEKVEDGIQYDDEE